MTSAAPPISGQGDTSTSGQPWLRVIALAAINSVSNSAVVAAPLWVGTVSSTLDLPSWGGGAIAAAQLLAAAVANIAASHVLTRLSPRAAGQSTICAALGGYLLAMIPNTIAFVSGMIIAGAALGALSAVVLATAARSDNPHRVFTILTAVHIIIASLFYAVAPLSMARWGFVGLFGLLSTLCIGALLAASAMSGRRVVPAERDSAQPLARRGHGLMGLLGFALLLAGYVGVLSYAVLFAARFGRNAASVGNVLAVASLASIIGPALGSVLAERFGRMRPISAAAVILCGSIALLAFGGGPLVFPFATIAIFTSLVFVAPYVMALLTSLDERGRWVAMGPAAIMAGSAIGPAAGAAVLAGGFGATALASVTIAFIAASVGALAVAARGSRC